jgi:hypothetical protein
MANEKSFPALIWVAFFNPILTGVEDSPENPLPSGLWTLSHEHPNIDDLPP